MASTITISNSFENIENEITRDLSKIKTEVLQEVFDRVKQRTPVSTGNAKNGWQMQDNQIFNDIEYIGHLEVGTIHNRPVGMVSVTLHEIDSIINEVINRI